MRRLIVSMIAAVVAVSLVPIASAQEEDDQVTLRVGLTQDWEVLNPTSGYTVAAYEVWNLHYATLTDKAADDFATIPGLAESWEEVEPGIEYVYTLREGLTWSDGEPLTAEDVAWNINTGRDQGWDNMVSTVANIEATAEDERTVRLVSSVPDPKLPTMDVYLVPQHIWEPIATDYDAATQYAADDGVGSGPFVMTEFTPGQSVVMEANPSYWGWEGEEPPYDQVIFRLFENPDAMVAALQQGEIDAAQGFPASLMGGPGGGREHRGRSRPTGWFRRDRHQRRRRRGPASSGVARRRSATGHRARHRPSGRHRGPLVRPGKSAGDD